MRKLPLFKRRWRLAVLLALCLTLLSAGVAVAQYSTNFDLACRASINAAGGFRTNTANTIGAVDAVGQTGVGSGIATSANFGIRPGYVQPSANTVQATVQSAAPDQAGPNVSRMPLIFDMVRVVRNCTF
jgi:hypothetical protein